MTVVYTQNGDRLVLDDNKIVGSGGEGSVFKDPLDPNSLIKVYENPSQQNGQKLTEFINRKYHLPKQIAAPTEVVYDHRHKIVGFRMPYFKNSTPLRKLSDNKYCLKERIGAKDIVNIHQQIANILNVVHPQGIVEGDLNDLNILFNGNQAINIDVDSWQFGTWGCNVATENFLSPRLYGIDLSQKPYFTTDDDWYSYAVLLHRGLLKVHPYGGTHPTFKNVPQRAAKKITVHDKGVIYPAIGLSPEVISDELSEAFYQFFKIGKINKFPTPILDNFIKSLVTCPSCQQEYPRNRHTCPTCKTQNQAAINMTVPGSVTYKELLRVAGTIIYHKIENNDALLVVAVSSGIANLYIYNQYGTQLIPLFSYQKGMRIDVSSKLVVVNDGKTNVLNVYKINGNEIVFQGDLLTDMYLGNNQAMFKVNNQHILHIIGSQLVDTTLFQNQFLHETLRQVMTNQTWFTSSSDNNFTCLGFYRVLRQQFFWLSQKNFSVDVKLPFLDTGEGLLDISVKYSRGEILILRHTKIQGKEYIRIDQVNTKGHITASNKHEISDLPSDNIHNIGFSQETLLHPTDQGVVRTKTTDNSTTNFSSTNKLVTSNHSIYFFQEGLLVINDKSVHQLNLN